MDELFIKDEKYLSTKQTGHILGYSNDYISKLCRDGLIDSERVGRAWYVKESTLEGFREKHEAEKLQKREELSKQRINEYYDLAKASHPISRSTNRTPSLAVLTTVFMFVLVGVLGISNLNSAQAFGLKKISLPEVYVSPSEKVFTAYVDSVDKGLSFYKKIIMGAGEVAYNTTVVTTNIPNSFAQANIFSSLIDKASILAESVYCNFSGVFGGGCLDNEEPDISETQIAVDDDVEESGGNDEYKSIIVYQTTSVDYDSLTSDELEDRLKIFESQLDISKGDTKVVYRDTLVKQSSSDRESVAERISDSITNYVTNTFTTEFSGATLDLTGDITSGGTVTALSFVGDGSGLTGLSTFSLASSTTDDLTEGLSNFYFTNERSRDAFSTNVEGLTYSTSTGILSLSGSYNIPLTASTTEWSTAFGWGDHSAFGYLTSISGLNISELNNDAGYIGDLSLFTTDDLAEGSTNLYSQWGTNGSSVYYNGGNVGIGTVSPDNKLTVVGTTSVSQLVIPGTTNTLFRKGVSGTYVDDELEIVGGSSGLNVLAIRNTNPLGFSANTFRDLNGYEKMAIGYGNPSAGPGTPFGGTAYLEVSDAFSGNGGSAPAFQIVQTTTYEGEKTYGFYVRQKFDIDGTIYFLDRNGSPVNPMLTFTKGGTSLFGTGAYFNSYIGGGSSDSLHLSSSTPVLTGGINVSGSGGYLELRGSDLNNAIVLREAGLNRNSYYSYGGTYASSTGHLFYAGGLKNSQTLKMQLSNDKAYIATQLGLGSATLTAPSNSVTSYLGYGSGNTGNLMLGITNASANLSHIALVGGQGGIISGGTATNDTGASIYFRRGIDGTLNVMDLVEHWGDIRFWTDTDGTAQQRMVLTGAGNVGIGTTTPGLKLTVGSGQIGVPVGSAALPSYAFTDGTNYGSYLASCGGPTPYCLNWSVNGTRVMYVNGSGYMTLTGGLVANDIGLSGAGSVTNPVIYRSGDANNGIYFPALDNFAFTTNGTERLRVDSSGNIGIGTTSPLYKLHVVGDDGSGNIAKFELPGGTGCTLSVSGTISCTSDLRFKKDVETINSSSTLSQLLELNPVAYHWKTDEDGSPLTYGFIAQEVEGIFPNLVKTESITGYKSLSLSGFIPFIVGSVQELAHKVTNIAKWFGDNGEKLQVEGDICVDDVCISKDQFKALIQNAGETNNTPDPEPTPEEESSPEPEPESGSEPEPETTPEGEVTPEEEVVESEPEPEPAPVEESSEPEPEPQPESTPEPESAPTE